MKGHTQVPIFSWYRLCLFQISSSLGYFVSSLPRRNLWRHWSTSSHPSLSLSACSPGTRPGKQVSYTGRSSTEIAVSDSRKLRINEHTHADKTANKAWLVHATSTTPDIPLWNDTLAPFNHSPHSTLMPTTLALYCFTFRTLRSQKVLCTMKKLSPLDWKLSATTYCIQCLQPLIHYL